MRTFKWTPSITVDSESPLVPVWISLPYLPIHLFAKGPLFSIARLLGEPLKIDASIASLSRLGVARCCVEVNVLSDLPDKVWIGTGSSSFWQLVQYENLPEFCNFCLRLGHAETRCHHHPANSDKRTRPTLTEVRKPEQHWIPK